MIETIGQNAGIIWEYLNNNGESTISAIKKETELKGDLVALALGWLAREDKVQLEKKGNSVKVKLAQ